MNDWHEKGKAKMMQTLIEVGMAGSHVAVDEQGNVRARILESSELLKLKELYDDFKDIPAEYSIYKEEDIYKTKDGI